VPAASTSSPAGHYPVLIVRADDADGLHWFATVAEDPSRRHVLTVPPGVVEIGPASLDGTVIVTSGTRLLFAGLRGDVLTVDRGVDLGRLGLGPASPACSGPDGSVAVANEETLALTLVPRTGSAVPVDVPDALGECAWLGDGHLLVDREGDRLLSADPLTGRALPVAGGAGRHPSTGGGALSLVDRSGAPRVVVRSAGLAGPDGTELGTALFEIRAAPGELISRAQLSPDGGWLAVEVILDPEAAAERRLRLYQIAEGAPRLATEIPLAPGERVILMPAP
jgi:hypothetical protein